MRTKGIWEVSGLTTGTPGKWHISVNNEIICRTETENNLDDAEYICKAVNSHDALVEVIEAIESFELQRTGNPQPVLLEFAWNEVIEKYKLALKLVEGE
ncbi:MAG: hypothetical protein KAS32_04555 [Candidatus Peribacteraceae bacterium]|nr:hypothetical protein [Candidatus Peribacteraceae bacterium]